MKIILIHNSHRAGSSSGDDLVFRKESELLARHGHRVSSYNPINDEFDRKGAIGKAAIAIQIPWSITSARRIRALVRTDRPDVAHVHNFFPLISPSVYHVLHAEGIPVVQTLHDYRFLCGMAFFMRDGRICEECRDGSAFRIVRHGCFKESRVQSVPVALMLRLHRALNTFRDKIGTYICLTDFQRRLFAEAGFNEARLVVKPNFVEDTAAGYGQPRGQYAVFIGRIGEEKGVHTLIKAWRALPGIPLKVIGNGPDAQQVKSMADELQIENIEFLGYRPHAECMTVLAGARFLVMPSIWYETFGLTIVEAFCHVKPVIASNLGAMADIVSEGRTGLLFRPGDAADLAEKVQQLWNDPLEGERMGRNARAEYEAKYTPEKNFEMLMKIYGDVIERHRRSR